MGTGGSFHGGKVRPGRDADHSPPSSAEVKNEQELYLLSPHVPPWRVAGQLYFYKNIFLLLICRTLLLSVHCTLLQSRYNPVWKLYLPAKRTFPSGFTPVFQDLAYLGFGGWTCVKSTVADDGRISPTTAISGAWGSDAPRGRATGTQRGNILMLSKRRQSPSAHPASKLVTFYKAYKCSWAVVPTQTLLI
jgi:hypothetical protein